MTGTTKEALKTSEIKTPEELIKRLETKSQKALADKVRTIEQSVTDGTESKWKRLQAELPESEKKEIETILGGENPEIGNHLKTAVEIAAGAAGITVAAAAINKQLDDSGLGKLGIKDGIKDWITETFADEPGEDAGVFDKIMHKIKMFFLMPLAKIFGMDLSKKNTGKEKEDGTKETGKESDKK